MQPDDPSTRALLAAYRDLRPSPQRMAALASALIERVEPTGVSAARRAPVLRVVEPLLLALVVLFGVPTVAADPQIPSEPSVAAPPPSPEPAKPPVVSSPAMPESHAPSPMSAVDRPRVSEVAASAKPTVRKKPNHAAVPAPSGGLREELALVERIREALSSADPSSALELVERHRRRYGDDGAFSRERELLRAEALCSAGSTEDARAVVARFLARAGDSALAARAQAICRERGPAAAASDGSSPRLP